MSGAIRLFRYQDNRGIRFEFMSFSVICLVFSAILLIGEYSSFHWNFHIRCVWRAAWSLSVFIISMVIPVWSSFDTPEIKKLRASIRGHPVSSVEVLKRILATPELKNKLMNHMMKEFAVENIHFIDEIDIYKEACNSELISVEGKLAKATAMYKKFIDDDGIYQINMPFAITLEIRSTLNGDPSGNELYNLYDKAY
eukprot:27470_1